MSANVIRVAVRADGVILPYHASLDNAPGVSIQDMDFSNPQKPQTVNAPQLSKAAAAVPPPGDEPESPAGISDVGHFANEAPPVPQPSDTPDPQPALVPPAPGGVTANAQVQTDAATPDPAANLLAGLGAEQ